MSWKVPSPHKINCACMYVSPCVELTHLTKPLSVSVLQTMLQKLTSATGPFAAPESTESEASLNSLQ